MSDDFGALRELATKRISEEGQTHYEGCNDTHLWCSVSALLAAYDAARFDREQLEGALRTAVTQATGVVLERDRLREALEKYGRHLTNCVWWHEEEDNERCGCGLRVALGGKPESEGRLLSREGS